MKIEENKLLKINRKEHGLIELPSLSPILYSKWHILSGLVFSKIISKLWEEVIRCQLEIFQNFPWQFWPRSYTQFPNNCRVNLSQGRLSLQERNNLKITAHGFNEGIWTFKKVGILLSDPSSDNYSFFDTNYLTSPCQFSPQYNGKIMPVPFAGILRCWVYVFNEINNWKT